MRLTALALIFSCGPAWGQVVVISCEPTVGWLEPVDSEPADFRWIDCTMRNDTQTPVASINYAGELREDGRTVAWGKIKQNFWDIPGGIEPGETVEVSFLRGSDLPRRANPENIVIQVEVTGAFDVSGQPIP